MFSFLTAYLIVWFAVLVYMVRLASQQRRLNRIVEALQKNAAQKPVRQRAA
jgi:CcmD family protein